MSDRIELTLSNLLDGLAGEIRSPEGPGAITRRFNQTLIEAYRASGGRLSGELATSPFLLLTTTGARSGKQRTTPLAYLGIDGRIVIIASKGGAQTHPAWYLNLVAHPEVTVELGEETYPALAVVIEGPERDRLYAAIASRMPAFADYQRRTERRIPVVELRRTST